MVSFTAGFTDSRDRIWLAVWSNIRHKCYVTPQTVMWICSVQKWCEIATWNCETISHRENVIRINGVLNCGVQSHFLIMILFHIVGCGWDLTVLHSTNGPVQNYSVTWCHSKVIEDYSVLMCWMVTEQFSAAINVLNGNLLLFRLLCRF